MFNWFTLEMSVYTGISSETVDGVLWTVGGIVLLLVVLRAFLFIYSIIRVFLLARYCGLRLCLNTLGSWAGRFLAASAGIWQSDYRRVGGRGWAEGNGDERTNLSSS